jgi:quercetin dioxygenase-like cupin family protein
MPGAKIIQHKVGKTVAVVGDTYVLLLTGKDTGGRYAIFEVIGVPNGGPPPHVHTREDENFYVIDGDIEFMIEGKTVQAVAGTFVNVPRGTLHTFKTGKRPARLLVQVCPAGLDAFFEEVGEPVGTPVTDVHIQKVMAAAPKYGIEIKI